MVTLGDEVKDTISGFKGIAISRHTYLQGCDRISVQPLVDKEGNLPESKSFDEPALEMTKLRKAARKASAEDPGGPEKYTDPGRTNG